MKIILKLTMGFLAISLLVGIVAYFGISATESIQRAYSTAYEETVPVMQTLEDLKFAGSDITVSTEVFISLLSNNHTENTTIEREDEELSLAIEDYNNTFKRYESSVNEFFPYEKGILEEIRSKGQKLQNTSRELIDLKKQGVSESHVQKKYMELEDDEVEFMRVVGDALAQEKEEYAERKENLEYSIAKAKDIILIASFFTFITAITIGFYLSNYFSNPIIRLKEASVKVGKGELDTKIDIKSTDEIGDLGNSFNKMTEDLKKYSVEITSAKNFLDNIIKSMADMLIVLDADKTIKMVNQPVLDILGFKNNELIGKHFGVIAAEEELLKIARSDDPDKTGLSKNVEITCTTKDGRKVPVSFSESFIFDNTGRIQGIVCLAKDITERKRAEEELIRANIELKKADELKTKFLSVVSHELRTPLTPINAQLQMILAGYFGDVTEKQKTSLEMILRNTTRLDRLIVDVLDISKLEAGVMKFNMAAANLNEVVENAVETMRTQAQDKNLKLTFNENKVPGVIIDKDRITQVIINLINNAIKFTDTGGLIKVELSGNTDHAIVKVKDNGIGIKKEDLERLFTPFQQVDSNQTRKYEGTGLGLAICKRIVTYHGGKIWIESEFGKGSTFQFTIPYIYKIREESIGSNMFEKVLEKEA
ncbi:MAG: ATP-binding protein [Candidatus Methanoperedens sp.]|nr:ATP-binding protein [Candidatus Methanoperedens sp.]